MQAESNTWLRTHLCQMPRKDHRPYEPMLTLNTFEVIAQCFNKQLAFLHLKSHHPFHVVSNDVWHAGQHFHFISKLGPSLPSSSEHQNSSGCGAKALFLEMAICSFAAHGAQTSSWQGVRHTFSLLARRLDSKWHIDFREALILIKQSDIRLEAERRAGDKFVLTASLHTRLKLSVLQTRKRPSVNYWSVKHGSKAGFGCLTSLTSLRWQQLAAGTRMQSVAKRRLLRRICLFALGHTPQCLPPQWSPMFCTVPLAPSNMTSGFKVSFFLHLISFSQRVFVRVRTVSFLWSRVRSLKRTSCSFSEDSCALS